MKFRQIIAGSVAGLLRGAVRAILGVTLVFVAIFLCWFSMELLSHLKELLDRTIFGHPW